MIFEFQTEKGSSQICVQINTEKCNHTHVHVHGLYMYMYMYICICILYPFSLYNIHVCTCTCTCILFSIMKAPFNIHCT